MMEQYLEGIGGLMFLRKLDLFSQPFYHRVDYNQKTKKTAFGGFISAFIIVLSLLYLIYILYLFFTDSYTPIITQSVTTSDSLLTQTLAFSPFAFTFRSNNAVFTSWNTYFAVSMYLSNDGPSTASTSFKIVQCKDVLPALTAIESHYCIDTNSDPSITLQTNQSSPSDDVRFTFSVRRQLGCTLSSSCFAEPILKGQTFQLELVFLYQRYDATEKKIKMVVQRDHLIIDPNMYVNDVYTVQKTSGKVDTGFLLPSWTYYDYISDFRKSSSVITNSFMQLKYATVSSSSDLLLMTQIQLSDSYTDLIVEYPKISIVLAQFQSIFSTLLILGILAKVGSENRNTEESMNLMMNHYYKGSALEIDQYLENKKGNKEKATLLKGKQEGSAQVIPQKDKIDEIKERAKVKNRLFSFYNFNILKHFYSDGSKINQEKDDVQLKSFKKMIKKQWSLVNAHQLHQEILHLKTSLQLLLTDKQYAAIEFVGRNLYPNEKKPNHLELLDQIDDDEDLRTQKAMEYYEELASNNNITNPIDLKFKESFIQSIFAPNKSQHYQDEEMDVLKDDKSPTRGTKMIPLNTENRQF